MSREKWYTNKYDKDGFFPPKKHPKKDDLKPWSPPPARPLNNTIRCPSCGHDTGLNSNGFHMVIPSEGLICPCGCVILKGPNSTLCCHFTIEPVIDNTERFDS